MITLAVYLFADQKKRSRFVIFAILSCKFIILICLFCSKFSLLQKVDSSATAYPIVIDLSGGINLAYINALTPAVLASAFALPANSVSALFVNGKSTLLLLI